ncbi:hypothetical protein AB0D59_46570 [Streptomyces sp. NPDC048417]|uniref:hypothetical protein n=1 Tax=Streptomyces sp. NPDC048417 TaxID=3155387 RepID=UPI003416A6D4
MNHDDADNAATPPGDNAPHFFDRYPSETAHWLAGICDEATAKAGDSPYDFRKFMCELIVMNLRDGIIHAFRVAEQLIVANSPGAKYIEERYLKYDQARAAVIETGPTSVTATGEPDKTDTPQTTTAGTDDAQGPNGTSGTAPGPGAKAGTGVTIGVAGGCGTGVATGAEDTGNTGIGHQGSLFIVHYSQFRTTISARRTKASTENKRLTQVRVDARRQIAANNDELAFLDRIEAADPVLEDLISTHRKETSIVGVLRAAGRTPEDLGLTPDTVTWLDTQLKAV